jgi:DNA invertase Pin-like site-specific DNA recombinase
MTIVAQVRTSSAPMLRASSKATEQPIASTAAGKCFLDMLGVFAEFEMNLRRERQLEGIAEAKVARARWQTAGSQAAAICARRAPGVCRQRAK